MGIKDHLKNMFNRGNESPSPLKSSELRSVEAEVDEITKGLEHERTDPAGVRKILKTPYQGAY